MDSSNTILIVEAKRDIPWTKPEDIEIDPDSTKPLPKFGIGRPNGEFVVAMADGSCRGALEALDPKVLCALFTITGGENIPPEISEEHVLGRKNPPPEPQVQSPPPRPDPRKIDLSKLSPAEQATVRREISASNLKQLGLCLLNYESNHRNLPPQAIYDKDGKPLLSWRVLMLADMQHEDLFKQFHLDEPWDSEHNKQLLDKDARRFQRPTAENAARPHRLSGSLWPQHGVRWNQRNQIGSAHRWHQQNRHRGGNCSRKCSAVDETG